MNGVPAYIFRAAARSKEKLTAEMYTWVFALDIWLHSDTETEIQTETHIRMGAQI